MVWHFNPRSPQGGATAKDYIAVADNSIISIHAPRKGERPGQNRPRDMAARFQSTLPARGSDGKRIAWVVNFSISIHAPRKGERPICRSLLMPLDDFNPRSPQGGATAAIKKCLNH